MKLNIPGDTSEGVTPVPIPNTEVKSFSAENTCYSFAGKIGHCQDSEKRSELFGTFFLCAICSQLLRDLGLNSPFQLFMLEGAIFHLFFCLQGRDACIWD